MDAQPSKTKLFISYARSDDVRVGQVYDALSAHDDLILFRDIHDILPSEEWKARLEKLIRESDTLLFLLSPASIRSQTCAWELGLAEKLNKRIIPVVIEDVEGEVVPAVVAKINYIFLTEAQEFKAGLDKIRYAVDLDIDWIRAHTRLGELAARWDSAAGFGAQPLRGADLEEAEQWLLSQPRNAPDATDLQRAFIIGSRRAQARRQRRTLAGAAGALVVLGVLAAFAWVQRNAALENERRA
ncbi:MAG: toll/interleukin-1 receptor domain-containing protein, partial [Pseudomonadota bacterium]